MMLHVEVTITRLEYSSVGAGNNKVGLFFNVYKF